MGQVVNIMYIINSLTPGRCGSNFRSVISKPMLPSKFMSTSGEIVLTWMQQNTFNVSGNGLVLSGNKPLHEPMLTQIFVTYDITLIVTMS